VIDFHCHLDLYPDPHKMAAECHDRGMTVLSVTTTPSAWEGTRALADNKGGILTALGLHPQLVAERGSEVRLFDARLSETRFVGEIGLDGSPEFRASWDEQIKVFEHILNRCAAEERSILSIHSRRAAGAVLDRLLHFDVADRAILHWFSGSSRELNRAIELGCWFSVGPAMLQGKNGSALAERLPKERVLTETDGPFAQLNGRSLRPWDVELAVQALATAWGLETHETENAIQGNLEGLLHERR
jgi:TatD DNase family protein